MLNKKLLSFCISKGGNSFNLDDFKSKLNVNDLTVFNGKGVSLPTDLDVNGSYGKFVSVLADVGQDMSFLKAVVRGFYKYLDEKVADRFAGCGVWLGEGVLTNGACSFLYSERIIALMAVSKDHSIGSVGGDYVRGVQDESRRLFVDFLGVVLGISSGDECPLELSDSIEAYLKRFYSEDNIKGAMKGVEAVYEWYDVVGNVPGEGLYGDGPIYSEMGVFNHGLSADPVRGDNEKVVDSLFKDLGDESAGFYMVRSFKPHDHLELVYLESSEGLSRVVLFPSRDEYMFSYTIYQKVMSSHGADWECRDLGTGVNLACDGPPLERQVYAFRLSKPEYHVLGCYVGGVGSTSTHGSRAGKKQKISGEGHR